MDSDLEKNAMLLRSIARILETDEWDSETKIVCLHLLDLVRDNIKES